MNRSTCSLVLVVAIAMWIVRASGQVPDKPGQGFLSIFKKDQPVILKEVAGRYEISLMDSVLEPLTHKVISVDNDFLVVDDISEAIQIRLPVYSIKAITTIQSPKN